MKKSRKTLFISIVILFILCLTACGDPNNTVIIPAQNPSQEPDTPTEAEPENDSVIVITPENAGAEILSTKYGELTIKAKGNFKNKFEALAFQIIQYKYGMNLDMSEVTGIEKIPDNAFAGCKGLKSVILPSGILAIGERAFYECSELLNITIPETVRAIENNAFYGCSRISRSMIPATVTNIGSGNCVEPPVITVADYNKVTITCSTDGADIYYNADGGDDFHIYEGTFRITETVTVKAFATKEKYIGSEEANKECLYVDIAQFFGSLYTPQSHTQIGNSPYELHCFGDGVNIIDDDEIVDAVTNYNIAQAQNYFKGKAQQIENNTADRPAIRAYYQDLINALNSVDQYSTMGDITIAVNEMAGRYMADIIRASNNGSQYDAIETAYKILALENMKSGFGADFVGYGDYDYRINKENFMQELAETNPNRNYIFEYCNVNIADEYTNGFQGTRTVLDGVTDNIVQKMNTNDSRFNNQLTLADEQMVYNVALATRALKSTARIFNSGRDRAIITEECQMQNAFMGTTYIPHIGQQNGNEQGL